MDACGSNEIRMDRKIMRDLPSTSNMLESIRQANILAVTGGLIQLMYAGIAFSRN